MCPIKAWLNWKPTHCPVVREIDVTWTQRGECARSRLRLLQQVIQLGHDLEGVGYVQHVGFAAGPATIGIEIDGAPLVDEAPADHVGFLAMTTRGKTFGVARSGAGLAHLIQ